MSVKLVEELPKQHGRNVENQLETLKQVFEDNQVVNFAFAVVCADGVTFTANANDSHQIELIGALEWVKQRTMDDLKTGV